MKNFILLSILLSVNILLMAQAKDQFILNGKITGEYSGFIHLDYVNKEGKNIRDSVRLKDNAFAFSGFITEPTEAYLTGYMQSASVDDPEYTALFLEPGVMKITVPVNNFKQATISGSQSQKEYNILVKERDKVAAGWDKAQEAYRNAKANHDSIKAKALYEEVNAYRKKYFLVYNNFIRQHTDSYISANFLQMMEHRLAFDSLKKFYNNLTSKIQASRDGKAIKEYIAKTERLAIGQPAPDFTQNNQAGQSVSLKDFKGKYVLLDFWASWCVPCRKESPYLVKAYDKYKDKNFVIVSISLDNAKTKEAWLAAIKKDGFSWPQLSDLKGFENAAAIQYNVQAIPANFLIDPNGKIIATDLRQNKLEDKLESIFEK